MITKPRTKTLNLEIDPKKNGNSTGASIDTLAIAVDGRDSNDLRDDSLDYQGQIEKYVIDEYNFEADMLKAASKGALKKWLNDRGAQNRDLEMYKEAIIEGVLSGNNDASPRAQAIQKALDDQDEENYREWIHGDYRNWPGILSIAARRYSDDGGGMLEFSDDKGDVIATIAPELIKDWIDEGKIKHAGEWAAYLEESINQDARHNYQKRTQEREKRRAEYEKTAAYKAEQAAADEKARRAKIKNLIKNK